MATANTTFHISVEELELIETALRRTQSDFDAVSAEQGGTGNARRINDLLGRLHNQKTFYRPRKQAYVGG